ncbi:PQQ-binding-like beta-propeller repeat protein [Streptomyces sp. NPDC015661]|uniref:outer membrane protein assembly factor BamB family protein n=1 Tax=Streptomyces sp. NPDC015661 TaxID=3364961 RepID=UPI0036F975E5
MPKIPRGVADASGERAVVHDRQGTLIALDLGTGAVLWRRGRALRPCAIVGGNVVALRLGTSPVPEPVLDVELFDMAEGTERWTSPALALPPWAHPTLQDSPEFTVTTGGDRDPLEIRWTARALYRGGAPPGPKVAGSQPRVAHGALRVGVATPSVEPLTGPATDADAKTDRDVDTDADAKADREHDTEAVAEADREADTDTVAEVPEPPPHPTLAADVLDYGQVGGLRMELTVRPGSHGEDAVVLRAVDARTAATVWEVVLDETAQSRPRRLRP